MGSSFSPLLWLNFFSFASASESRYLMDGSESSSEDEVEEDDEKMKEKERKVQFGSELKMIE